MCEMDSSFEKSIDSGICLEMPESWRNSLKEYRRILYALERDKDLRDLQREKLSKLSERKPKKKNAERCNVCFEALDSEDFKCYAKCCNCGKSVCRGRQCSVWLPSQAGWECQLCNLSNESRSRASEWVQRQAAEHPFHPMRTRSELHIPTKGRYGSRHSVYETTSEAPSSIYPEQKERVREYVEEVVANMLGGPLDEVPVGQLYKSRDYLPLTGSQNDYCDVSRVKLKRLIEKVIEDVLHLPALIDQRAAPPQPPIGSRPDENLPPYFDPKKYQELLATAVLNKIVDSYNNEKNFTNTENPPGSDFDKNHNTVATREKQTYSSSSSIEPHSDSSVTDAINFNRYGDLSNSDTFSNFADNVNFSNPNESDAFLTEYLSKHKVPLPDLSVESETASEDFISIATSNGMERSSWEDNWLFKRKKHPHDSPAPVGMLVPAPREDIRALIGDKTADEMSDLSEAGSDYEGNDDLIDVDESYGPPNALMRNKHVIGGKGTVGLLDELLEQTSMISTSSLQDNESAYAETRNDFIFNNDGLNEVDRPSINLRSGSIPIETEAVNALIAAQILQNSPPKSTFIYTPPENYNEAILEPPSDFTDFMEQLKTEETLNEHKIIGENSDEAFESGSPSSESNGGGASLESNTDDSSTTVIDMSTTTECKTNSSFDTESSSSEPIPTNNINTIPNTNGTILPDSITNLNLLSKSSSAEEDPVRSLRHLIPGSIAEREHKKWYNAVEMPNNPYAPEALIRRLSDGPERPMDIPSKSPVLEKASDDEAKDLRTEESEEGTVDYRRYSRDYYINDSKHASGSRQYSSASKFWQSQSIDGDKEVPAKQNVQPTSVDDKSQNLFFAKPIRVDECDPILSKATKVEHLSTPERDYYILPTDEAFNLKRSSTPSDHNSSQTSDSLPTSEDSDTVRIYDLNKQETRIIKDDTPKTVTNTPTRPTILSFSPKTPPLTKVGTPTKVVTPPALRFLQPKRKLFDPKFIMASNSEKTSPIFEKKQDVQTPTSDIPEKPVIEEEVASSLPSVKALARAFLMASSKASAATVNKPKASSWQSVDQRTDGPVEEELKSSEPATGPSPRSYSPPYEQEYCPVASPEIPPIAEVVIEEKQPEPQSPQPEEQSSSSPALTPGQLRNSIAFFENLKKK